MKKINGKRVIALLAFMIASLHTHAQTTIRPGSELCLCWCSSPTNVMYGTADERK